MNINLEGDIDVRCAECGTELDDAKFEFRRMLIKVYPCNYCMRLKDEEIKDLNNRLEELSK